MRRCRDSSLDHPERLAVGPAVRERSGMVVRLAQDQDLEKVAAVWHETRKKTHTALGLRSERGVTLDDSRRIFRESEPDVEYWWRPS